MFGDNKTVDIQRIVDGEFTDLNTIKCRYEPKKFTAMREAETKISHITFRLFCDNKEIKVTDKIIHGFRSFIVSGIMDYDDQNGSHLEVLMVEENTWIHETVTIDSLATTQDNYDELLGEWVGDKTFTTRTANVLMDAAKLMKNKFMSMTEGGAMENIEYVMTILYPEEIINSDKIIYKGDTYEIKWIIHFPHQLQVGLDKYIKTYVG